MDGRETTDRRRPQQLMTQGPYVAGGPGRSRRGHPFPHEACERGAVGSSRPPEADTAIPTDLQRVRRALKKARYLRGNQCIVQLAALIAATLLDISPFPKAIQYLTQHIP